MVLSIVTFLHLFIYWSCRIAVFLLFYRTMHLQRGHLCQCYLSTLEVYVNWFVDMQAFIGFLLLVWWPFLQLLFLFAVSCLQSMTREVVDYWQQHTLLLSAISFGRCEHPYSRRRSNVPNLLSIIITIHNASIFRKASSVVFGEGGRF